MQPRACAVQAAACTVPRTAAWFALARELQSPAAAMTCTNCKQKLDDNALYCGWCGRRSRVRRDSRNGTIVDDTYRIEEALARGGFGTVYRATHLPTGTAVAIKILHADLAANPKVRARFARESVALSKLRSRNTVVTFHRGESHEGTLYIVMELLVGESLGERLQRRGRLAWREALVIMRDVCRSLAEAHACGIIHRDLKPSNIHLDRDSFVKVLDFGLAKLLPWSGIEDADLTAHGEIVGTLEYMAPEQMLGTDCDPRSDIYALGIIGFELIAGRRPFADATNPAALVTAILTQSPEPLSAITAVPADVDRLIMRCIHRDPDVRFSTVVPLASAIDRVLHSPAIQNAVAR